MAPGHLLAVAMVAAATFACSKSNASHSDAALPASDATPDAMTTTSDASAEVSAKNDDARTGIGG